MKMNFDRLNITLIDMRENLPDFEITFSDFYIDRDECSKDSVELLAKQ